MEQFDAFLAQTIDSTLGLRCTLFGYQYREILHSLMCVYLCGGKERIYDDMNETSKMDKTSRRHVLNIFSDNYAYANLFQTFGKLR